MWYLFSEWLVLAIFVALPVLLVIGRFTLRKKKLFDSARLVSFVLFLGSISVSLYFLFFQPYRLDDVTDRCGRVISNPNMINNPEILLFWCAACYSWINLLTTLTGKTAHVILCLLVPVILLIVSFVAMQRTSVENLSPEKRESIYDGMGGRG
ncbi:MAG TPA: hypothetical protein VFU15_07675 [Bacteroidia bacterium]|nr:hypothetical protein [Bacteroidia bacterium]